MTKEDLEKLATEYASSKERKGSSVWSGLKYGFIAGYNARSSQQPVRRIEYKPKEQVKDECTIQSNLH